MIGKKYKYFGISYTIISESESDAEKCLEHFEDYDRREILCVSNRLVIFFTLRHTFKNIGRNTPFLCFLVLVAMENLDHF